MEEESATAWNNRTLDKRDPLWAETYVKDWIGGQNRAEVRKTRGITTKGVGRYVCVGNYYIITQISRWVHSLRCRYPVLWPRAKGDSRPGRCLEMVRGVPIRLIHVYYEVTFYRRTFTTNRSYKIARKNRTRNDRFRDLTFPPCILRDRHDFNSLLTFFPPLLRQRSFFQTAPTF